MAKVKNSLIGQLSGRVGGFVFTSNKSGPTVRAGTIPTNPRTQVQVRQRTIFGVVSRLFRAISGANRVLWQEFADNYFNPKEGSNTGQFSGYNAFTALRNVVQQAYRLPQETFIIGMPGSSNPGYTQETFTPMPNAPIPKTFTGAYKDVNGNIHMLTLLTGELYQDGEASILFQVGDGTGYEFANLISPEDYKIGYVCYISNGNPAPGLTYGNKFAQCLGYIAPVNITTPFDIEALQTISFNFQSGYNYSEAKRFPIAGEYVLMTIYGVNKYGQLSAIDTIETQMQA